jgi:IS1 family transposase
MNRLPLGKRVAVVKALVEGNSIRATVRMTGVAKQTILDLLADLGPACEGYQGVTLRDLPSRRIECDEIWSFCYAKAKNVPKAKAAQYAVGDVWTWVALDPESKLVLTWRVGKRTPDDAERFMSDLASRVAGRIQITTDGYTPYVAAVFLAFGKGNVDFAQLIKKYARVDRHDHGYSPAVCVGAEPHTIFGSPDERAISTSYVERQNLTMRMGMRRMTRLTNGFSKKLVNLENAVALHYMHYNFCRPHITLNGKTPAMAAGVADHIWRVEEVIALLSPVVLASAA